MRMCVYSCVPLKGVKMETLSPQTDHTTKLIKY